MMLDLDKYFYYFYTSFKNNFAYKWDTFFTLITRVGTPLIMLAVWTSIYLGSHSTTIGGFSLAQTYSYFFAFGLMTLLINQDLESVMQNDVVSGLLAVNLSKPVNYIFASISSDFASQFWQMFVIGLPLAVILILLLQIPLTQAYLLVFLLEIAVGLFFYYVTGLLLGTLALYLTRPYGVYNVYYSINNILAGGYIPLNFFPTGITNILQNYLPFQILVYTPATTFLHEISITQALQSTGVAVIWAVALVFVASAFWKMSIKRIAIAGG